jgi:hypothetical protein
LAWRKWSQTGSNRRRPATAPSHRRRSQGAAFRAEAARQAAPAGTHALERALHSWRRTSWASPSLPRSPMPCPLARWRHHERSAQPDAAHASTAAGWRQALLAVCRVQRTDSASIQSSAGVITSNPLEAKCVAAATATLASTTSFNCLGDLAPRQQPSSVRSPSTATLRSHRTTSTASATSSIRCWTCPRSGSASRTGPR